MDHSIKRVHPMTGNGDPPPRKPNRVPAQPLDDQPVDAPVDETQEPTK